LSNFRFAGDSPGTREFSSNMVDSRFGDLARSQTDIWLHRMPTSPTRRFYGHVDWICKHLPTFRDSTWEELVARRRQDWHSHSCSTVCIGYGIVEEVNSAVKKNSKAARINTDGPISSTLNGKELTNFSLG
jgi:hypothetical protein